MSDATADGRFEVPEDYAFIGRTFAEYAALFDLDPEWLAGRSVLDCPGGPAAFTAVASELGADAVAVDPEYGPSAGELAPRCREAAARVGEQLREKRDLFVWDYYGDPTTRERYLRAAAERFLADYARHPGRYLQASLPDLPLPDDAVSLTLSGNFLFTYDDRMDEAFHHAAMAELCRVTREEVRVFPLASLDRTRSAFVDPVVDRLRADGREAELRPVPYEFQPGATEMLVARP